MAAHTMPQMPGAHERRLAERTRSARLIRESISLLSSKWSVDILLALGDGTRRYHELLEDLQPISEKVLTQTLRSMERDGVVARRVHAEVPPRVEYALTPLGRHDGAAAEGARVVVSRPTASGSRRRATGSTRVWRPSAREPSGRGRPRGRGRVRRRPRRRRP